VNIAKLPELLAGQALAFSRKRHSLCKGRSDQLSPTAKNFDLLIWLDRISDHSTGRCEVSVLQNLRLARSPVPDRPR
jgi:hypothetical protein